MTNKSKALGLALFAATAVAALAAASAAASVNGHFTSDVQEHHVILKGTSAFGTAHQTVFREGTNTGFTCTHNLFHGTASGTSATTTQEISLRPEYKGCATENGSWGELAVHVPTGCGTNVYKITSRSAGGHDTVHVECEITITHPNCTLKVPKQTPAGGVTYTAVTEAGVSAITADITATGITIHYEGGICIFLGTTHTFAMNGSITLWSESTAGNRVSTTAT